MNEKRDAWPGWKIRVWAAWEAGQRRPEAIAVWTGLELETVRRALRDLKRSGAIADDKAGTP